MTPRDVTPTTPPAPTCMEDVREPGTWPRLHKCGRNVVAGYSVCGLHLRANLQNRARVGFDETVEGKALGEAASKAKTAAWVAEQQYKKARDLYIKNATKGGK